MIIFQFFMRKMLQFVIFVTLAVSGSLAYAVDGIVVYSARNEQLIKPLFDAYTRQTGISIQFITDKEGSLLEKLKAEGANTPADLLITVDAGNLWQAAHLGVLQAVQSSQLMANIPAHLRDPGNQWFGLSVRARTLVYNKNKVSPAQLSTYEALGDAQWKGRLCLRTSKKVYNQSLVAMLIAEHGEQATEKIVKSWVANLATDPFPDDTKAMEAVAAGQCDVTVVNTYYFGRLMEKMPNLPLGIYWPNQNTHQEKGAGGVHVNSSGAGITRHAKHKDAALKFLEWLSSEQAQNMFADANLEYPVNPRVKPDAAVAAWGDFRQSTLSIVTAGELQGAAVRLMDRAQYK